jgi:hypothetical protein
MGYPNVEAMTIKPKVLLIQGDWIYPDYQADLITIGMRKVHTYTLRAVHHRRAKCGMFYNHVLICLLIRFVFYAVARKSCTGHTIPPLPL